MSKHTPESPVSENPTEKGLLPDDSSSSDSSEESEDSLHESASQTSEQPAAQSPLSAQPPTSDVTESASTSTTTTTTTTNTAPTTPGSAAGKKNHKGLNIAGLVIPTLPLPNAKPAGPDAVSGASGLVAGIKSTKKVANTVKVPTYYPVAISDGTNNHHTFSFPSNRMRTTKYTAWSFLFKLLWEQYKKATNIFFLGVMIITLVQM